MSIIALSFKVKIIINLYFDNISTFIGQQYVFKTINLFYHSILHNIVNVHKFYFSYIVGILL